MPIREKRDSADKQVVQCISEVYPTDLRVVERTEERGWEKKNKVKEKHLPGRPSQPTCIHLVEKVKEARISTGQRGESEV